ncbi:asparagine synthase-related protein [Desulfobulbus propionicus]
MPGIAGFANLESKEEMHKLLDTMLKRMTYREDYSVKQEVLVDNKVALGKTDLGILRKPEYESNKNFTSLFDGEVYDKQVIAPGAWIQEESYTTLRSLNGSYAFVCLDEVRNLLFLVSDKFGSRPLYYTIQSGSFAFASEVKALCELPGFNKEPDRQAFADCYHFGFVLGNKTLFVDTHLLPPASVLCFNLKTGTLDIEPYWHLVGLFTENGSLGGKVDIESVVASFGEAVDKRLGQIETVGVSLSGGLDSRAILAAMGQKAQGIHSYTLGLPGCQDEKLSAKLAQIAKTHHTFLEIGSEYLGDFLELAETLVCLSDGFYHPHESTEKRALDYFKTSPFRIALRGHGGEIAKASLAYPVQVNKQLETMHSFQQINQFIYQSANLGLHGFSTKTLFQKNMQEILEKGAWRSLEAAQTPACNKLSAVDQCVYFYIQQWIRRQVFASLAIFRTQQEVRLPYLDDNFLQKLLALPVSQRYSGEVHVQIVRRYFPDMIKVVNSNTGAPLDAGKMQLFMTEKFNAVLKRLSLPGYRHYTEFQKWQREHFRSSIERILFDQRTMERGLYRQQGLRDVFDSHVSGRGNFAHLLGTIVGLELWYRNFID